MTICILMYYIDRVVLLLCDGDVSNLTKANRDPEFYCDELP